MQQMQLGCILGGACALFVQPDPVSLRATHAHEVPLKLVPCVRAGHMSSQHTGVLREPYSDVLCRPEQWSGTLCDSRWLYMSGCHFTTMSAPRATAAMASRRGCPYVQCTIMSLEDSMRDAMLGLHPVWQEDQMQC